MFQENKKFAEMIKNAAEFKKNFNLVTANTGPTFPSASSVPGFQPSSHANAAATTNALNPLGFRYFQCLTCGQPEIVPFYVSADPKNRGGLSRHECQLKEAKHNVAQLTDMDSNNIRDFFFAIQKWTDLPTVYALKADPTFRPTPEWNHVNFGKWESLENYIRDVIRNIERNKATALGWYHLWDFLSVAKATYCLCEFTLNGSKQLYFMFISQPLHNPAANEKPRTIVTGSGITF